MTLAKLTASTAALLLSSTALMAQEAQSQTFQSVFIDVGGTAVLVPIDVALQACGLDETTLQTVFQARLDESGVDQTQFFAQMDSAMGITGQGGAAGTDDPATQNAAAAGAGATGTGDASGTEGAADASGTEGTADTGGVTDDVVGTGDPSTQDAATAGAGATGTGDASGTEGTADAGGATGGAGTTGGAASIGTGTANAGTTGGAASGAGGTTQTAHANRTTDAGNTTTDAGNTTTDLGNTTTDLGNTTDTATVNASGGAARDASGAAAGTQATDAPAADASGAADQDATPTGTGIGDVQNVEGTAAHTTDDAGAMGAANADPFLLLAACQIDLARAIELQIDLTQTGTSLGFDAGTASQ